MNPKLQRELAKAADEILLKDGKAFYDGAVRLPSSAGGEHRRRKRKDVIYAAIERYYALDPDDRAKLRKRYQEYNPAKSRTMLDWQGWLVEYFDGMPLPGTSSLPQPDSPSPR